MTDDKEDMITIEELKKYEYLNMKKTGEVAD